MATLESRIDDLYRLPLDQFTAARATLSSELAGPDRRRAKSLKKPTAVPWAVNQVYWHARSVFDGVLRSGAELRRAQIDALKGRQADVRSATEAHRKAIAAAVEQAARLGEAAHVNPGRDALARTFEALSLAPEPPEPLGRLTHPLQPGGFEMLAGVKPLGGHLHAVSKSAPRAVPHEPHEAPRARGSGKAVKHPPSGAEGDHEAAAPPPSKAQLARERRAAEAAARNRERDMAAVARRHKAAVSKAEAALRRARHAEERARRAWEQTKSALERAERGLAQLQFDTKTQA